MQRKSSSVFTAISSLFSHATMTPVGQPIDPECIATCKTSLVEEHHLHADDAALLLRGLPETDLYILMHLIKSGDAPAVARKKIDDNDIDVIEMRTIESPLQRTKSR